MTIVESATNPVYYHATFSSRVPTILKQGLVLGKRRTWGRASGGRQGLRAIYLFSDPVMAVRWAHKMQFDFDRPASILVIENPPGDITADDHVEAQMNGRTWFHTNEPIPPECIARVVPLTLDLTRAVVAGEPISL
jgi:hypothetical protein